MGLKESGLRGSLRNVSVGISAIPDSTVERPDDNNSASRESGGIVFESTETWPSIGFEISSNTSGFDTAELIDTSDSSVVESKDVSDLSGGDTFTMEKVNLSADTEYAIIISADSGDMTVGQNTDSVMPISGDDGVLTMVASRLEGDTREDSINVRKIGNIGGL